MTGPATSDGPRPSELDAFEAAVLGDGRVRVPLASLWAAWAQAAPRWAGVAGQAAALRSALETLAARDVLGLPKGAWDPSTSPPLPSSVTVASARTAPRDRRWVSFPWRAELGWVSSLRSLSDGQFDALAAVNDWLGRHDWTAPPVPVRYRSVELFGAEKRLEELARSSLFGPGRLSLDLLGCARLASPVAATAVGDGPDILVVENADTYWVAAAAARQADGPVGAIVWGSGRAFPSQVPSLTIDVAGRGPVAGRVWYWGDVDPVGVDIALAAAAAGVEAGLGVAVPLGLWAASADAAVQEPGSVDWSRVDATRAAAWFGEGLWDRLGRVRSRAGRVAQEAVGPSVVSEWLDGPA